MSYSAPRRKRHPIRTTIIVLIIIGGLGVSGYLVAESLASTFAKQFVQAGVSKELGSSGAVHANLGKGSILLQVVEKKITTMHVTIDGFTSGTLTGSAVFDAEGVPLNTTDPVDSIDITVRIPAAGLAPLVDAKAGDQTIVELLGGDIRISDTRSLAGKKTKVTVDYVPSSSGTDLVLTPEYITIGPKRYTPAKLKASPYRAAVGSLLETRRQCLAASLPSKLSVKSISVVDDNLVVDAAGSGLSLGSLGTKGTCS